MKHRRAAGVGKGPLVETANWRAVRGFPARRHMALCAWNAASKGGTSVCNSSRVTLVTSRNSVGRAYTSVNWTLAIRGASVHGRHRIS
jgi:hypothetical protein